MSARQKQNSVSVIKLDGSKEWWRNGELHREDGPAFEGANGTKEWYRNGQLHRDGGPALEGADGSKVWFWKGELHRDDGPAVEYVDGHKVWYRNGQRHREDGPALEWADGFKMWYRNGQLHRDDGPAIEWASGDKWWWRNGVQVEPFTESMDPDELEAIVTSVIGPQPETDKEGNVRWYRRGLLHRDDGPAIEYASGSKWWYRNGLRHREDGPAIEWADGFKEWYRNGVKVEPFTEFLDPDEPEAIATSVPGPQPETDREGTVRWFWRGLLHRDDGPAIEYVDGSKWWCRNGKLHREDGPAVERVNGDKRWYRDGLLHRDDGPAIEGAGGDKWWYQNGVQVKPFTESQEFDPEDDSAWIRADEELAEEKRKHDFRIDPVLRVVVNLVLVLIIGFWVGVSVGFVWYLFE